MGTKSIVRHEINTKKFGIEFLFNKFYDKLPQNINALKAEPFSRDYGHLCKQLYDHYIAETIYINRTIQETYTCLYYSHQLGLAIFKLASNPGREVTVRFGNTDVKTVGKETKNDIHPADWISVFALMQIMRDNEGKESLSKVDNNILLKTNVSVDTFDISFVNFLKNINDIEKRNNYLTKSMIDAENPKNVKSNFQIIVSSDATITETRKDILQQLFVPLLMVYEKIFRKDNVGLNEMIINYLNKYKAFIISKKMETQSGWWLAKHLLAALAFAHDNGMSIEVESDYIPAWLYKGEFDGLEPEFV